MRQSRGNSQMLMDRNLKSAFAEEFRSLRLRLELYPKGGGRGTLAVASAEREDGRTTVAANLAIAFSLAGKRTLLVDADLRRPRLHDLFYLQNRGGLTNLLGISGADLRVYADKFIQETHIEHLSLLPAGEADPNAPDRQTGEAMGKLMRVMKEMYDVVIVDTPPALEAAEAAAVAAGCDGVLLVARSGRTSRRTLLKVRDAFAAAGADVRGVTLNRAARSRRTDALRSFSGR